MEHIELGAETERERSEYFKRDEENPVFISTFDNNESFKQDINI